MVVGGGGEPALGGGAVLPVDLDHEAAHGVVHLAQVKPLVDLIQLEELPVNVIKKKVLDMNKINSYHLSRAKIAVKFWKSLDWELVDTSRFEPYWVYNPAIRHSRVNRKPSMQPYLFRVISNKDLWEELWRIIGGWRV